MITIAVAVAFIGIGIGIGIVIIVIIIVIIGLNVYLIWEKQEANSSRDWLLCGKPGIFLLSEIVYILSEVMLIMSLIYTPYGPDMYFQMLVCP